MCIYILLADDGQAILVDAVVVLLNLAWDNRNLAYDLHAHGLCVCLLLVACAQHLAVGEDGHVLLGLQFGNTTCLLDKHLEVCLDAACDVCRVDGHRVYEGLVVEQLLLQECLECLVHGVAVGGVAHLSALVYKGLGILRNL